MEQQSISQSFGTLIKDGFYDPLILLGYPYDQGASACGIKKGQDYGPERVDSFRRFVHDIGTISNPEYDIDISKGLSQISDYGNIQILGKHGQKELLEKLSQKVGLCILRQKLPFVIGGTRDMFQAIPQAISKQELVKKTLFILFRSQLDIEEVADIIHQKNSLRASLSDQSFSSGFHSVKIIGLAKKPSDAEMKELKRLSPKIECLSHEDFESLQRVETQRQVQESALLTKIGQYMYSELQKVDSQVCQIVVSISLEAIEGVTGVSRPCLTGITTEEAIEVCLQVGNSSKVVAIDICDYNPFIEDWSTGRLVATMFYHLALGYSARLQQRQL